MEIVDNLKPIGCHASTPDYCRPLATTVADGEKPVEGQVVSLICGDRKMDLIMCTGTAREEMVAKALVGFCVHCPNRDTTERPNF